MWTRSSPYENMQLCKEKQLSLNFSHTKVFWNVSEQMSSSYDCFGNPEADDLCDVLTEFLDENIAIGSENSVKLKKNSEFHIGTSTEWQTTATNNRISLSFEKAIVTHHKPFSTYRTTWTRRPSGSSAIFGADNFVQLQFVFCNA